MTTNAYGDVQDDGDYRPFGGLLASYSGNDPHYGFTGHEADPDGTRYAVFRNLDIVHGRWNRPDPYLGSYDLSNPQSFNRYIYVVNNPTHPRDPLGLNQTAGCHDVAGIDENGNLTGEVTSICDVCG